MKLLFFIKELMEFLLENTDANIYIDNGDRTLVVEDILWLGDDVILQTREV